MFCPLHQYQVEQDLKKKSVMNKNVININKDSLTFRALLNIMPSYKILISPIMATLKAETYSYFTFLYQTQYVLLLTDAYRLLTTSVSYSSSAVAAVSSISILASHLCLKLPGFYFQLSETNFVRIYHFSTSLTLVFNRVPISSTNIWCMRLKRGLLQASRSKAPSFFGFPSQSAFHHFSVHI